MRVTLEGTYHDREFGPAGAVLMVNGRGYRIPEGATVEVIEPKGFPWYNDELRKGDCDRLPAGTILRTATGTVFVKSNYQGHWFKPGELAWSTEDQILAREAKIVWLPEEATR